MLAAETEGSGRYLRAHVAHMGAAQVDCSDGAATDVQASGAGSPAQYRYHGIIVRLGVVMRGGWDKGGSLLM